MLQYVRRSTRRYISFFFFQAEDGIRDYKVTGVQTCALPILIPYAAEIEALRRIPPAPFGVLMSLEPAVAALVGLIALGQSLDAAEILGVGLVDRKSVV